MLGTGARVSALCRYPVKSMQGEDLRTAEVGPSGFAGDRMYAIVDTADGKVASAKHPRRWGQLLSWSAAFIDEPDGHAHPPVVLTGPDGTQLRSDHPDTDAALSRLLGREVSLVATPGAVTRYDSVWPDIDGLVPEGFLQAVPTSEREGETIAQLSVTASHGSGFFDVAPLHILTTGTLAHLASLRPEANLDWRRFRPNVLVETPEDALIEDGSGGTMVSLGPVRAAVTMPTMRCVMTTLAQRDLPADRSGLQAIAAHNRVEIPGLGTWACAGLYAEVTEGGTLRIGDPALAST